MRHIFKSLAREGYAYAIHDDHMALFERAYRGGRAIHCALGEFKTYGDALTQHEVEYAVQAHHFADALASAAAWLVEALPSLDEKTCREVAWFWPDAPSERDIEWALSVKYDAAKPRWYSLRDRKVSASTSKANDRRWEKVPEWCDGSVKSASTLLRPDDGGVGDLLRAWVRYDAVCAFASRVDPSVYYEQPQEFFREVIGEQPSVWSAFEAARCAFNAARQLHAARGQLATYKFNTASENSPTTSPTAQEGAP